MGSEALVYLIVQALIAKAVYFEQLKQQGKTEAEIKEIWKAKWATWKTKHPELDLPVI